MAVAEEIRLYNPESEHDIENWGQPPVKFGPFLLFSDLTVSQGYNDNILAQHENEEGDFITSVKPYAQLVKSFGRHDFSFAVSGNARRYWKNHNENTLDWDAAFWGNLEAQHSLHIPFKLAYSQEHQDRTNRRLTGVTKEPVDLNRKVAQTGFIYEPNRLRLEVLGAYEQLRVDDATLLLTGAPVSGKEKDKNTWGLDASLSYDLKPNFKPVIKLQYSDNTYLRRMQTPTGFDGMTRDNNVFRMLAGFIFDYKGLIGGMALFGKEKREYKEANAESVSGFSSEVKIHMPLNERLNAAFGYSQRSHDDNLLLTGLSEKLYTLDLKYDLTADWTLNGGGSYRNVDYLSSDRVDDMYGAYGSVVYRLRRGLELEGSYRYQQRDSTEKDFSFDQSIMMLSVRKQF